MKLIDICEEEKETTVILKDKDILFYGHSEIAPEDMKYKSAIFGGRLAESRAQYAVLKYKLEEARKELHTLDNLLKACSNTKRFNKEEDSAKVLFHQYNVKKKQIEKLKEQTKAMKEGIKLMIENRDKYIKKLEANRTKADKE